MVRALLAHKAIRSHKAVFRQKKVETDVKKRDRNVP